MDIKMSMKIKEYNIEDLISAEYNPRQLKKEQFNQLRDSIQRFGLVDPVIVNTHKERKNIVVGGHQRLKVAESLNIDKIPCVEVKLNLDKERELNIRLNKNVGEWDYDNLANFFDMDELKDWGFSDADFKLFDIEEVVKDGLTDDDEVPEVKESTAKLGDLWLLGEHRLLCGDATKKEDVEVLMDGQKADMVFTDPPYGVDYDGGIQFTKNGVMKGQRSKLKNDDHSIYSSIIPTLAEYCNGAIYTWFAGSKAKDVYSSIDGVGDISALIIWVKNGGYGALNAQYKQKHEPCLYWKPKNATSMNWCGSTTENTIWEIDKDGKNKLHPTQKPVELGVRAISNHKADKVLDLFLGSGSTLIACEKTGRKCYGMELDPHYCDVIIKRWEDYTGKSAKLYELEAV
tara:strand:+ start:7119 stop:8321 length:1203 start_codon:yes stop_codon:yes gene_type:complete